MFTKDMISPCGLDCSICKRALAGTDLYRPGVTEYMMGKGLKK